MIRFGKNARFQTNFNLYIDRVKLFIFFSSAHVLDYYNGPYYICLIYKPEVRGHLFLLFISIP